MYHCFKHGWRTTRCTINQQLNKNHESVGLTHSNAIRVCSVGETVVFVHCASSLASGHANGRVVCDVTASLRQHFFHLVHDRNNFGKLGRPACEFECCIVKDLRKQMR